MAQPMSFPVLSESPLVSVLVACFNYARFLPRAIESVLQQTYVHLELVICDDGSTDDSAVLAESYARTDGRVRVVRKSNGGVASALNAAYAVAQGEIMCLMDADDYFLPEKVGATVDLARNRAAAGLLLHEMAVVDEAGRTQRVLRLDPRTSDGWIAADVLKRGGRWRSVPASALSLRRELAQRLFPLSEADLKSVADGYILMLAPLLAEVAFVPDILSAYRLHGGNLTGAVGFSAARSTKYLEGLERITRVANAWLKENDADGRQFHLDRHLNYSEHAFWLSLLDATPGEVSIGRYSSALMRDDLYGRLRKAMGIVAGVGAMVVPGPWRASWLTLCLGESRLRRIRRVGRDPGGGAVRETHPGA